MGTSGEGGGTKQDDWPEGRPRSGKLPPYNRIKLPKGVTPEFAPESFRTYSSFPINFLLFSLLSASFPEFFLNTAGNEHWESRS